MQIILFIAFLSNIRRLVTLKLIMNKAPYENAFNYSDALSLSI